MTTNHDELLKRVRKAAMDLGWNNPFFAIPIARIRYRITTTITETAAVSADGTVFINPEFAATLKERRDLTGVIAHEVMHLLTLYFDRMGSRIPLLWNYASDMAINYVLKKAGIFLPSSALMPRTEWENWNAEKIYAELDKSTIKLNVQMDGAGKPMPLQGCGVLPPNSGGSSGQGQEDQKGSGSGNGERPQGGGVLPPTGGKSMEDCVREWTEVAAAAVTMAKAAIAQGEGAGNLQALIDAVDIPPPRVKWQSIIRQGIQMALAAHGRDVQTWSRRGRRSGVEGPQFPGWRATSAKVVLIIDTSGSMSDEQLLQFVSEAKAICDETRTSIFLAAHDYICQYAAWISPRASIEVIKRSLKGRGGTACDDTYKRVEEACKQFDVGVHFTDGYIHWPPWPTNVRKMIVALLGYQLDAATVPDGARVVEIDMHDGGSR